MGCGGGGGKPVPLSEAINPVDEHGYTEALKKTSSPRDAFYMWMSSLRKQTLAEASAADTEVSETDDPTNRENPIDVSRGAVIYKHHCLQCHGLNIDGRGPDMKIHIEAMDFTSGSKRFAISMGNKAPGSWYQKVAGGLVSKEKNPDGSAIAMPKFSDTMAREQIWLAIAYMRSITPAQK